MNTGSKVSAATGLTQSPAARIENARTVVDVTRSTSRNRPDIGHLPARDFSNRLSTRSDSARDQIHHTAHEEVLTAAPAGVRRRSDSVIHPTLDRTGLAGRKRMKTTRAV